MLLCFERVSLRKLLKQKDMTETRSPPPDKERKNVLRLALHLALEMKVTFTPKPTCAPLLFLFKDDQVYPGNSSGIPYRNN